MSESDNPWNTPGLAATIIEQSANAVFLADPEQGTIVAANERAAQWLEYSSDELIGMPMAKVHPDEVPKLMAFARTVFQKGTAVTYDLSCMTKSGRRLPSELSAYVVEHDDRQLMIVVARDRSEEDQVRRENTRITAMSRALTDAEQRHRMRLKLNNAIASSLTRSKLLPAIADALSAVIEHDFASIVLYDAVRDVLQLYALAGSRTEGFVPVGSELPRAGSHLQSIIDDKEPMLRPDLQKVERNGFVEQLLRQGIRSFLGVPLIVGSRVIGTLNVGRAEPDGLGPGDRELIVEAAGQVALAVANMQAFEEIAGLKSKLEQENVYLQEELRAGAGSTEIVGGSQSLQRVLDQIDAVARTNASVLILGESGVGKELVARAIHERSPRASRPLVKVNCASVPKELFESEFFGHIKGAFTGAVKTREGRFALADGGTIFLDEVGEIPVDLQGKLLRVLQEHEFERVGEDKTRKVDVRVLAATNRDLKQEVEEGRFRQDLYYRLSVFPIAVPALRERLDDVPALAQHLLAKAARELKVPSPELSASEAAKLQRHSWPGNIRELQNVMERVAILSAGGGAVPLEQALPELADARAPLPEAPTAEAGRVIPVAEFRELERNNILAALERAQWKISGEGGAADLLGLKPSTLTSQMKSLGIKRP